tara:strand:- start:547 stop:963 length:417 start_codon:yes stop_codon:yes gene_type:complete
MNNKLRESYKTSKDIFKSFEYAYSGLIYCFKSARNFRIQIFCGISVLILCIIFNCNLGEKMIIISTIFSVLILELINTAIESLVDLTVKTNYSKLAKVSKDCSAASVLLASINSIFIALYIFFPKFKILLLNKDVLSY